MNYNRKALKQEAKALIRETRPKVWLVTLVLVLLIAAVPQVVQTLINPAWRMVPQVMEDVADLADMAESRELDRDVLEDMGLGGLIERAERGGDVTAQDVENALGMRMLVRFMNSSLPIMFVSVFFALFTMVMTYGYRGYALRVFRREKAGVGSIFAGVPLSGRVIGTEIMVGVFTFLWTLLIALVCGVIGGVCALFLEGKALSLVTSILSLVATFLSVLVTLRYCLAPFFVMSGENSGVFDSITASKKAMKGNYIKKFVLDLSFLGWELLVFFVMYVLLLAGILLVLFTAGSEWIMELVDAVETMKSNAQLLHSISESIQGLIDAVLIPMGLVVAATWLITLPLTLWLQAYMTITDAGFFLTVTGQAIIVDDEPAPTIPALVEPSTPAEPPVVEAPAPVEPAPLPAETALPEEPVAEEAPAEEPPAEEPVAEEAPADEPPAEEPQTPAE